MLIKIPAIEKIRQFGTAKKIQSDEITTEICVESIEIKEVLFGSITHLPSSVLIYPPNLCPKVIQSFIYFFVTTVYLIDVVDGTGSFG